MVSNRLEQDERQQENEDLLISHMRQTHVEQAQTRAMRGGESFTPPSSAPPINTRMQISKRLKVLKSAGIHSMMMWSSSPRSRIL